MLSLGIQAWISAIAIAISSLIVATLVRPRNAALRSIPGPRVAALTGAWRNLKYFQGRWMQDIIALHDQHGPVVRIAPNEVSITDQDAIRRVYGFDGKYSKTSWYDTWRYAGSAESVFTTRHHEMHRFLRKRVHKLYSMSSILTMEHLIDDVVNLSLQQLHRYASERRTVRLDAWTMFFAYEVVSSLALGQTTGFLERGEDVNGIIESNHMGFWLNSNVGYLPGQSTWFANYYFLWFMTKLGSNFAAISDWIDGAVKDGRISQTNYTPRRSDLLQCFFEMTDMDGKPASDEEVASEIGNVLGAGADTTGTLIVAALRYLIANPDDYRRVQQEVDNEHRESGLSNDQEIKYASLAKLPFLCAVIQESLRLHPSIVYQLPRESLTSATMVGDYLIPPGVSISVSPTAANRSTEVFGLDANTWRPQRWIEKDESADSVPSQDSLMTFGRGSRGCLGKNLALVEAHKYIASFVRNFEASFKDPEYQGKIKSFFFAKIEDVEVVLVSRRRQ